MKIGDVRYLILPFPPFSIIPRSFCTYHPPPYDLLKMSCLVLHHEYAARSLESRGRIPHVHRSMLSLSLKYMCFLGSSIPQTSLKRVWRRDLWDCARTYVTTSS